MSTYETVATFFYYAGIISASIIALTLAYSHHVRDNEEVNE